ncbi:MAG: hypothetical protein VB050_04065 [Geobacteraceae bacterium]|nr:hypothetical protein [Geobacteraceae bacterium]
MLNIFFISNDDRVARLIEYYQPRLRSKIRLADNFDHGLKEVFENRPSLVFIQNSINSVSGETVARHIKSLLGSVSPQIVYLDETGSKNKRNASWCDEWMRMAVSEQQFRDEFAALVSRLYPDDWNEDIKEALCGPSDSDAASLRFPGTGEGEPAKNRSGDASGEIGEAAGQSHPPEQVHGAGKCQAGSDTVLASSENDDMDAAIDGGAESARSGFRRALLLAVLSAAVAFAVYCLLIRENKVSLPSISGTRMAGNAKAMTQADKEKLRGKARQGLPAFIRPEWRDQAYSSTHPGWERYVSPQLDFRIYRNVGMMKALQIIAVEGQPLSDPYMASVFSGLGYPVPAQAAKGVAKGGFLMEKSVLDDSAEIVIYRDNDGPTIRALVIVFP